MKTLQLTKPFTQVDGSPLVDATQAQFTLKKFLVDVLGSHQVTSGEEAVKAFTLAQDIYKSEEETLEVNDDLFELAKKACSGEVAMKKYTALIIGQSLKMLE